MDARSTVRTVLHKPKYFGLRSLWTWARTVLLMPSAPTRSEAVRVVPSVKANVMPFSGCAETTCQKRVPWWMIDATLHGDLLDLVDQDLTVDAEGLVAVLDFDAKVVGARELVRFVLDGHTLEVEAEWLQKGVQVRAVEYAESIRNEHGSATRAAVMDVEIGDGAGKALRRGERGRG